MREDWIEVEYKDLVNKIPTSQKKLKQNEYFLKGKYAVVDQGQELIGGYTDDEANLVQCNLPVVVFGDHTKAVKYINFRFAPGADGIKILEPKKMIIGKYLSYVTQHLVLTIEDKGYARHYQYVEKLKVLLPSLSEQRTIVEKIEELFSELDSGVTNLLKAKEKLEIYRQAVLKKAFEGELTKEWREKQLDLTSVEELQNEISAERKKYIQKQNETWKNDIFKWEEGGKVGSKPSKPRLREFSSKLDDRDVLDLARLPDSWFYNYLAYAGDLGRGKSKHRPRNDERLFGGDYPFVQTAEVRAQDLITEYTQTYSDFGFAQSKLWPKGTLCITIAANIAETGFLGIDACFPDSVVGFTPFESIIDKRYIDYFFKFAKRKISAWAPATAQKNINLNILENIIMPFCSIAEQKQVVMEIETRLSVCDNIQANIDNGLNTASALRQSILKRAFEGKLLSEEELEDCKKEPDWESAEKLLDKIKDELRAVK